eukprot:6172579-Pleurochrysis_carterae.AAC.5
MEKQYPKRRYAHDETTQSTLATKVVRENGLAYGSRGDAFASCTCSTSRQCSRVVKVVLYALGSLISPSYAGD